MKWNEMKNTLTFKTLVLLFTKKLVSILFKMEGTLTFKTNKTSFFNKFTNAKPLYIKFIGLTLDSLTLTTSCPCSFIVQWWSPMGKVSFSSKVARALLPSPTEMSSQTLQLKLYLAKNWKNMKFFLKHFWLMGVKIFSNWYF